MQAIDFETQCQRCHRLDFDLRIPDRQVPHGKLAEVQFMLDEFYSKIALEGGYDDVKAPVIVRQRRRPGQPPPSVQEQREALQWARDKARSTADSLFNGRACGVCHQVRPTEAASGVQWTVAPVRVSGAWYAKASFTHARHATMDCGDCHAARLSMSSADLLIPDIGVAGVLQASPPYSCRSCHGGEQASTLLGSTCTDCHGFHQSAFLLRAPSAGSGPPH
jgi:hypothetical protein